MEEKKRKILIIFTSAFLLIILSLFFAVSRTRTLSPILWGDTAFIFFLWSIILILIFATLFLLLRNIFKLLLEKKQKVIGVHFKSRLILFFVGFTLVPTILLFFFASDLISRNIDQWFNAPLETIVTDIDTVTKSTIELQKKELLTISRFIAENLKYSNDTVLSKDKIKGFLIKNLKNFSLDTLSIYVNKKELISALNPQIPLYEYKNIPESTIIKGIIDKKFTETIPLGKGILIRAGYSFKKFDKNIIVVAGIYLGGEFFTPLRRLSFNVKRYNQLKRLSNPIKITYLLIFLFITLFIIFGAMWLAVHIAREITVPVELLASATEKIRKGDFNVKINYKTSGEFELLIDSFNRMVDEIKERRTQVELQKNEIIKQKEFQDAVLENIRAGVIIIDKHLRVYRVNSTAREIIGFPENTNIKNKTIDEIFKNKELLLILEDIKRIIKLSPKEYELQRTLDVKGERRELVVRFSKIITENSREEFVVVIHDITQAINAKRLSDWKNIAEKVAHELKNPLTPIKISAQRILRNIDKEPEKVKKIAEESAINILTEIEGIMNLLSNFLTFARLPEPKLKKEDINLIIEDVVSFFREIYSNIEFDLKLTPYLGELMMDKEQIKRVLTNLINNSAEAMDKKGKITIKTFSKNNSIYVEFVDSGPGIPENIKEEIFTPYFSTKEKGTGLGLAIVKQIIKEHKGDIYLDTSYKKGAKFIMRFTK